MELGNTNIEPYLIGLAQTKLVIQAQNPSEALAKARDYRQENRSAYGYHPFAVPYLMDLMEIDDDQVAFFQSLAARGVPQTVALVDIYDPNPLPPSKTHNEKRIDDYLRQDVLQAIGNCVAILMNDKIRAETVSHTAVSLDTIEETDLVTV